jgi:hypothetical protein
MELKILQVIEEQIAVGFTGKVNVLARLNRQFLGHLLFKDGEIIQVLFPPNRGLKAFYQLIIQEFSLQAFDYVVEPEIVESSERQINLSYEHLKQNLAQVVRDHRESLKFKPPGHIKMMIDPEFLDDSLPVSSREFEVLSTLTEWSAVNDVYQHCQLLEHEVTLALVSLRKKGALKLIAAKNIQDDLK